ncbi:hypothetical protein GYB22_01940 [bacterium]|nr:hypothetical protein [bacterium]
MKAHLTLLLLLLSLAGFSQRSKQIDSVNYDSIRNFEYRLETLSYNIINSEDITERITSCYYFVQTLKQALQVPQSFNYNFTSLKTVSVLRPDDNKFRVFTWNLLLDSGKYMYFGAIQMNNLDSLVLFGLYDSSEYNKDPYYSEVDNHHWMGALYYQMHHYRHKRQDYYLMFGWDGQDSKTNRKIIDVLWFNEEGMPMFGKEIFDIGGDLQNRVIWDFADNTAMLCRYDKNEKKIVFANLVPINPAYEGRYETYVPDGSYDYLVFQRGVWVREEGLFNDRMKNSNDLR